MISRYFATALLAVFLFSSSTALGHVRLDSPNGGESYRPGQVVTIVWHPLVNHGTIGWELEYSLTGPSGPWLPIDLNIPAGNIAAGSVHNYLWTVPNVIASNVWVRIHQVNPGTDYYDSSNNSFEIKNALAGDITTMSVSAGGSLNLNLDASPDFGSEIFTVLGNFTGTSPGISYQGFVIPLNQDFYFDQTVLLPNFPPLTNSLGILSATGTAQTVFTLAPGVLDPSTAGIVINHAAIIVDNSFQVQLVSNPVSLLLTP